jgi:hypothetical protein
MTDWPCKHGVVMNKDNTIHFFGLFTFNEGIIRISEELVDAEHPLRYKPLDHIGYVRSEEGQGTQNPIKELRRF